MADPKMPDLVASSGDGGIFRDPRFEVTWEAADKENPRTWPVWYRSFIVAAMSFSTTIVYVLSQDTYSIGN